MATRASAAHAVIAAGAAAVLVLWWHSTRAIAGPGGFLTTAGEGLGLLAGYAVVIAVLLMARLPPVERGIGADRLARWHATIGRYTIGLISGHVLFIIWGYALQAHSGLVSETHALPSDDLMRITVRDVGDLSNPLRSLRPGTRVFAEGPYGAFIPVRPDRPALLVAGGVGITPLRAMLAALTGPVTLIYRASSWPDVVFSGELDALAAARGGSVHYVVGSRSELSPDPLSPGTLRDLVPGLAEVDAYVCGPPGMTAAAVTALAEAGEETGMDVQIGQYAFPRLIGETLIAQSARIDTVSGATYTSGGYLRSLQSALDNRA